MEETFVTFEMAKKLKELGYDWKGIWFYRKNGVLGNEHVDIPSYVSWQNYNDSEVAEHFGFGVECSAPTLAEAQKWLREIKKLSICVHEKIEANTTRSLISDDWHTTFSRLGYYCKISKNQKPDGIITNSSREAPLLTEYHKTYEEALSHAIDFYLNKLLENNI